MRIVYVVAGAGGMYCGACTRDVNLVRGLIERGHDVEVIALYTPLHTDYESKLGTAPIFYGGINVYLQQVIPLFRRTPAWADGLLDSPALLNWASKFAIRTRAEQLGPMTVSVLQGKHGKQKKELDKLIDYLASGPRPDVVNITNSLLSGIAPEIKSRLNVPVACTLQGEDGFVGVMPEPHRSTAESLMRENARSIDLFISPGDAYSDRMSDLLSVPRDRVRTVRAGIDTSTYRRRAPRPDEPFVIGYLSVITPAKGLDILAEAFIRASVSSGRELRLAVAGKVLDEGYWNGVTKKLADAGLEDRLEYVGEVDLAGKVEFLRRSSAFSVPSRIEESRAMAVMEAMASGVPVLVPDTGVFPEMMELTSGGVTVRSGDSAALAEALVGLINDSGRASSIGDRGAAGIELHYSDEQMAEQTLAAYSDLLQ